jgi:hypothetical protein
MEAWVVTLSQQCEALAEAGGAVAPHTPEALITATSVLDAALPQRAPRSGDDDTERTGYWADLAEGMLAADRMDWPAALAAYTAALGQVQVLAWHGLDRDDRLHALTELPLLAEDAAAAALHAGFPSRAVTLLEQGRGVLLSEAIGLRTDRSLIRRRAPELGASMDRIRAELDMLTPGRYPDDTASRAPQRQATVPADPSERTRPWQAALTAQQAAERRRGLARQWDELVEQARKLPGMDDFLRPPAYRRLRAAADGGPVVIVNTSRYRCNALIVEPDTDEPRVVRLDGLSTADIARRAGELLGVVGPPPDGDGAAQEMSVTERRAAIQSIDEILAWLWDVVAAPILDHLGLPAPAPDGGRLPGATCDPADVNEVPWPRMWWCPTGLLTLLPLHAAGRHRLATGSDQAHTGPGRRAESVPDRVVCSYTPTLRALAEARIRDQNAADGLLLVAVPFTADGADPLSHALEEADCVLRHVPDATRLVGPDATRDRVLEALPEHAVVRDRPSHWSLATPRTGPATCPTSASRYGPASSGWAIPPTSTPPSTSDARRQRPQTTTPSGLRSCRTSASPCASGSTATKTRQTWTQLWRPAGPRSP